MSPCRALILSLCILPGCLLTTQGLADETRETRAVQAAEAWLALVDHGQYAESWDNAATLFRNAVTKEQWQHAVKAARSPLGALKSRELASSEFASSLPGAPDGEYVVIRFNTSFENKQSAVETITPMKDSDGEWRVSGYFVR